MRFLLAIPLLLTGLQAAQAAPALPATVAQKIDAAAAQTVSSGQAPGVAVEVSIRGHVVYARGFGVGDLDTKAAVTPETGFRIGSLTKQFTSAAILRLVEDHRLSLDDKLSRFFPDFPGGDGVTIREMLQHTSGIHNYTEVAQPTDLDISHDFSTAAFVAHIAHQKSLYDFPPGTAWHYSNSGYFMLGAIVEKLTGKPLAVALQEMFFAPLHMRGTAIDGNIDGGLGRARGYDPVPGHGFKPAVYLSMSIPGGAGALRSSANDLTIWANALFGGRVVNKRTLVQMTTPARLLNGKLASTNRVNMPASEPASDYGLGLRITATDIGHEGDIFGYNATLDYLPARGVTLAILANAPGAAKTLRSEIEPFLLSLRE